VVEEYGDPSAENPVGSRQSGPPAA
jgi:hypothetical protein